MKRVALAGCSIAVLLAASWPLKARAAASFSLGDDGEAHLGVSAEVLGRYTDFTNPDSNNARSGTDAILRRGWITLDGHYTDYVTFLLRGESVLNCKNCVAGTEDSNSARVLDASVTVHYKDLANLAMGVVKPPSNRQILTVDQTMIGIDRPAITGHNLSWGHGDKVGFNTGILANTKSGLHTEVADRDIGTTLFGMYSFTDAVHFKYYLGVYKGVDKSNENQGLPRYTLRLQVNLLDPEPGFDHQGTYLGTKKTISIAYTHDYQDDLTQNIDEDKGGDFSWNELDLFIEYPIGPGSWTFDWAWEHNCMIGLSDQVRGGVPGHFMNQTEGVGIYALSGYYFPRWKLQPWIGYEYWDATDEFGTWEGVKAGVTYYIRGFDANVRLGYERIHTQHDIGSSPTVNSGRDNINTLVLALYLHY